MIETMWAIARAIGGISLNGDEYLMDGNGEILVFGSEQKALRTKRVYVYKKLGVSQRAERSEQRCGG